MTDIGERTALRGRLAAWLFAPRDIAALVAFRVLFGALLAWDFSRYVSYGWIHSHYVDPPLNLTYAGFDWVKVLPAPGMFAVFGVMVATSLTIALGAYYRASCVALFLAHTYVFLVEAAHYLNHAYLISLLCLLMAFLPAHRSHSIDVLRRPELHRREVPAWATWLLVLQLLIVYVYGAVAKMNADWLAGVPLRQWLEHSATEVPYLGEVLASEWYLWSAIYGGIAFDLFIVPMLLWRRTRLVAVVLSVAFHGANAYQFHIGVFPWLMMATLTLFFEPDWPRRLAAWGGRAHDGLQARRAAGGAAKVLLFVPGVLVADTCKLLRWLDGHVGDEAIEADAAAGSVPPLPAAVYPRLTVGLMSAYLLVQVLLPLRHHLYPSDVVWSEEGHNFSWRMKLRNKNGRVTFLVREALSQQEWHVHPSTQLTERQVRKMACKPDLMLGYVHYLAQSYEQQLGAPVQVFADSFCSVNYRPEQRFIDPTVDLAQEPRSLRPYRFIVPMKDVPVPRPDRSVSSLGQPDD